MKSNNQFGNAAFLGAKSSNVSAGPPSKLQNYQKDAPNTVGATRVPTRKGSQARSSQTNSKIGGTISHHAQAKSIGNQQMVLTMGGGEFSVKTQSSLKSAPQKGAIQPSTGTYHHIKTKSTQMSLQQQNKLISGQESSSAQGGAATTISHSDMNSFSLYQDQGHQNQRGIPQPQAQNSSKFAANYNNQSKQNENRVVSSSTKHQRHVSNPVQNYSLPASKMAAPLTTLVAQESASLLQGTSTVNKDSLSMPLTGANSIDPTRPGSSKVRAGIQKMKVNPQQHAQTTVGSSEVTANHSRMQSKRFGNSGQSSIIMTSSSNVPKVQKSYAVSKTNISTTQNQSAVSTTVGGHKKSSSMANSKIAQLLIKAGNKQYAQNVLKQNQVSKVHSDAITSAIKIGPNVSSGSAGPHNLPQKPSKLVQKSRDREAHQSFDQATLKISQGKGKLVYPGASMTSSYPDSINYNQQVYGQNQPAKNNHHNVAKSMEFGASNKMSENGGSFYHNYIASGNQGSAQNNNNSSYSQKVKQSLTGNNTSAAEQNLMKILQFDQSDINKIRKANQEFSYQQNQQISDQLLPYEKKRNQVSGTIDEVHQSSLEEYKQVKGGQKENIIDNQKGKKVHHVRQTGKQMSQSIAYNISDSSTNINQFYGGQNVPVVQQNLTTLEDPDSHYSAGQRLPQSRIVSSGAAVKKPQDTSQNTFDQKKIISKTSLKIQKTNNVINPGNNKEVVVNYQTGSKRQTLSPRLTSQGVYMGHLRTKSDQQYGNQGLSLRDSMGVVIQNQRGKVGEILKNNFVNFENQQSSQQNQKWDQQTGKSALQTIPYGVTIGSSQDNRHVASKTFTGDKSDMIPAGALQSLQVGKSVDLTVAQLVQNSKKTAGKSQERAGGALQISNAVSLSRKKTSSNMVAEKNQAAARKSTKEKYQELKMMYNDLLEKHNALAKTNFGGPDLVSPKDEVTNSSDVLPPNFINAQNVGKQSHTAISAQNIGIQQSLQLKSQISSNKQKKGVKSQISDNQKIVGPDNSSNVNQRVSRYLNNKQKFQMAANEAQITLSGADNLSNEGGGQINQPNMSASVRQTKQAGTPLLPPQTSQSYGGSNSLEQQKTSNKLPKSKQTTLHQNQVVNNFENMNQFLQPLAHQRVKSHYYGQQLTTGVEDVGKQLNKEMGKILLTADSRDQVQIGSQKGRPQSLSKMRQQTNSGPKKSIQEYSNSTKDNGQKAEKTIIPQFEPMKLSNKQVHTTKRGISKSKGGHAAAPLVGSLVTAASHQSKTQHTPASRETSQNSLKGPPRFAQRDKFGLKMSKNGQNENRYAAPNIISNNSLNKHVAQLQKQLAQNSEKSIVDSISQISVSAVSQKQVKNLKKQSAQARPAGNQAKNNQQSSSTVCLESARNSVSKFEIPNMGNNKTAQNGVGKLLAHHRRSVSDGNDPTFKFKAQNGQVLVQQKGQKQKLMTNISDDELLVLKANCNQPIEKSHSLKRANQSSQPKQQSAVSGALARFSLQQRKKLEGISQGSVSLERKSHKIAPELTSSLESIETHQKPNGSNFMFSRQTASGGRTRQKQLSVMNDATKSSQSISKGQNLKNSSIQRTTIGAANQKRLSNKRVSSKSKQRQEMINPENQNRSTEKETPSNLKAKQTNRALSQISDNSRLNNQNYQSLSKDKSGKRGFHKQTLSHPQAHNLHADKQQLVQMGNGLQEMVIIQEGTPSMQSLNSEDLLFQRNNNRMPTNSQRTDPQNPSPISMANNQPPPSNINRQKQYSERQAAPNVNIQPTKHHQALQERQRISAYRREITKSDGAARISANDKKIFQKAKQGDLPQTDQIMQYLIRHRNSAEQQKELESGIQNQSSKMITQGHKRVKSDSIEHRISKQLGLNQGNLAVKSQQNAKVVKSKHVQKGNIQQQNKEIMTFGSGANHQDFIQNGLRNLDGNTVGGQSKKLVNISIDNLEALQEDAERNEVEIIDHLEEGANSKWFELGQDDSANAKMELVEQFQQERSARISRRQAQFNERKEKQEVQKNAHDQKQLIQSQINRQVVSNLSEILDQKKARFSKQTQNLQSKEMKLKENTKANLVIKSGVKGQKQKSKSKSQVPKNILLSNSLETLEDSRGKGQAFPGQSQANSLKELISTKERQMNQEQGVERLFQGIPADSDRSNHRRVSINMCIPSKIQGALKKQHFANEVSGNSTERNEPQKVHVDPQKAANLIHKFLPKEFSIERPNNNICAIGNKPQNAAGAMRIEDDNSEMDDEQNVQIPTLPSNFQRVQQTQDPNSDIYVPLNSMEATLKKKRRNLDNENQNSQRVMNEVDWSVKKNNFIPETPKMAPSQVFQERIETQSSIGKDCSLTPRTKARAKLKHYIQSSFRLKQTMPPTTVDFYRIGKMLGKGAFGKVNMALHRLTEHMVAIKSINKNYFSEDNQRKKVLQEVFILKQTRHHNIVRLFEYFETQKHILFVIEICAGGDLLNYVRKRRQLKENMAKSVFKQLINGLAYCHSKSILHRDIKLDNILLSAQGEVKICDFGVSKVVRRGEIMHEQCGTPAYIAPEILKDEGYEGFSCDIWSSGVVLYAMLYGIVPFRANNMSELQKMIIKADYKLQECISEEARDLLRGLLEKEPAKRLTVKKILEHPWLADAQDTVELFTNAEKNYIKSEFTYNDNRAIKGGNNLEGFDEGEESDAFVDALLETNENSLLKNSETKSVILAPFNSTKSHIETEMALLDEIKDMLQDRRCIKFAPRVREIDKQYEVNNNAELDNGVQHDFGKEEEEKKKKEEQEAKKEAEAENSKDKPSELQMLDDLIKREESQQASYSEQNADNLYGEVSNRQNNEKGSLSQNLLKNEINEASLSGLAPQNSINSILQARDSTIIDYSQLERVSEFGFPKEAVKTSIINNELNSATTSYFLIQMNENDLRKEMQQDGREQSPDLQASPLISQKY